MSRPTQEVDTDLRLATALLVAVGTLPAAEKPNAPMPIDVYLLGGQSNMQGSGKVADLPVDVKKDIPHTFFWNGRGLLHRMKRRRLLTGGSACGHEYETNA